MARVSADGVNKSEAIRDAVRANKGEGPKAIAEMLVAKGIKVTPAYVSMVKSGMKGRRKKRRAAVARGNGRRGTRTASGMGSFAAAVEFVKSAGGLKAAKKTLSALEEIRNLK